MSYQSLIVAASSPLDQRPRFEDDLVTVTHIHESERSSTVVAVFRPGGGLRPHYHRHHDEIIIFVSGKATFRIGDEIKEVSAHDVISVPAGTVHATLRAETECVLAAVFAPRFDLVDEDRVYVDP